MLLSTDTGLRWNSCTEFPLQVKENSEVQSMFGPRSFSEGFADPPMRIGVTGVAFEALRGWERPAQSTLSAWVRVHADFTRCWHWAGQCPWVSCPPRAPGWGLIRRSVPAGILSEGRPYGMWVGTPNPVTSVGNENREKRSTAFTSRHRSFSSLGCRTLLVSCRVQLCAPQGLASRLLCLCILQGTDTGAGCRALLHQAPAPRRFSRHGHWSGPPCPPPRTRCCSPNGRGAASLLGPGSQLGSCSLGSALT